MQSRSSRLNAIFPEHVIIVASSISSDSVTSYAKDSAQTLVCYGIHSGEIIRRFKGVSCERGTQTITFATNQYMFALHATQKVVDVYGVSNCVKDQRLKRFVLNKKASTISSNETGEYCAVGFEDGTVQIWERSTGRMVSTIRAHFKKVTKIMFTSDQSCLITCSEDTVVSAWSVSEAMSLARRKNLNDLASVEPVKSWTSHQLGVTDCVCSKSAGAGADLVVSCSIDRTVKVFSMMDGVGSECLATYQLPKALTAIAMDGEDRCVFVGSCDGEIYEMNINGAPAVTAHHDIENESDDDDDNNNNNKSRKKRAKKNEQFSIYRGHNRAIVTLHCTRDGLCLVSTSEDGTIRIWDRASGKCTRTLKHPKGDAPIATAILAFRKDVEKVNTTTTANVNLSTNTTTTTTTTTSSLAQGNNNTTNNGNAQLISSLLKPSKTEPEALGTFERFGSATNHNPSTIDNANTIVPWDGPLIRL